MVKPYFRLETASINCFTHNQTVVERTQAWTTFKDKLFQSLLCQVFASRVAQMLNLVQQFQCAKLYYQLKKMEAAAAPATEPE